MNSEFFLSHVVLMQNIYYTDKEMVTCFIIDFIDSNINREALLSQTLWKNVPVEKKNRYANSILLWFRWKSHQQIVSQLRSLIVLVSVSLLLLCTTTEEKTQQQPIFHFFSWRLFEMFRNRITDTRTDAIVWLWLGMVVALVHFLRVHFPLFVSRPFERWRFDSQSQNLLLIKPMRCYFIYEMNLFIVCKRLGAFALAGICNELNHSMRDFNAILMFHFFFDFFLFRQCLNNGNNKILFTWTSCWLAKMY